jgi:3-oxoacyl-[acyl-carrier protein] reductase
MRIAAVTGGKRGLGKALCDRLISEGWEVVAPARGEELEACQRDLSLLINNVGPYQIGPLLKCDLEHWRELFESNLFLPATLTQAAAPALIANRGSIINIGVAGLFTQRVDLTSPLYRLTKQALWGATRTWARELAPHGVRVNMVSPGQLEDSEDLGPNAPRGRVELPMGTPVRYAEVVDVVMHLLDPATPSVTGQNIEVAGGYAI